LYFHSTFMGGEAMRCQTCGCEAQTKYVEFYQNIGALVMRFTSSVKGNLCKRCINKHFMNTTLITAAVGWFGMISFCVTPFIILNNIVRFCGTIGMELGPVAPPRTTMARRSAPGARMRSNAAAAAEPAPAPKAEEHPTMSLTAEAIARLEPFRTELHTRVESGEDIDRILHDVGPRAGVSAMQVEQFLEQRVAM
jgi:hypothetical protein